jgi:hypothetical protein
MESAVIVVAIFAVVIIVAALAFRHRLRASIKGPGRMSMEMDATNPLPRPGVQAKNITAQRGGVTATNETGSGIDVDTVNAYKDVNITNRPSQESLPPKSPPLA